MKAKKPTASWTLNKALPVSTPGTEWKHRKHIENIYRKLQVHNKLSAVDKAKDLGVL